MKVKFPEKRILFLKRCENHNRLTLHLSVNGENYFNNLRITKNTMAIYDFEFAETLIHAAQSVKTGGLESFNAKRAVLYLSQLSIEISLKAILENAGVTIPVIKSRSHNLDQLMTDLCFCEIKMDIGNGTMHWVSAAQLRSISVIEEKASVTIGTLLSDDDKKKSRYPNEIRYGDNIKHYLPQTMLEVATIICDWGKQNSATIRIKHCEKAAQNFVLPGIRSSRRRATAPCS